MPWPLLSLRSRRRSRHILPECRDFLNAELIQKLPRLEVSDLDADPGFILYDFSRQPSSAAEPDRVDGQSRIELFIADAGTLELL